MLLVITEPKIRRLQDHNNDLIKTQMTTFCRIILKEEKQSVWVICT